MFRGELGLVLPRGVGARAPVEYTRPSPPTVSWRAAERLGQEFARQRVGDENVVADLDPSMSSADFAFRLRRRPGAYFRIGQGGTEPEPSALVR